MFKKEEDFRKGDLVTYKQGKVKDLFRIEAVRLTGVEATNLSTEQSVFLNKTKITKI